MSTFNISDITFAGAYVTAMDAARDSDRRNADRYVETGESRQTKFHGVWYSLPVRVAAAGMVFVGCILGATLVAIVAT